MNIYFQNTIQKVRKKMDLFRSKINNKNIISIFLVLLLFIVSCSSCFAFFSVGVKAGKYIVELSDDIIKNLAQIGKNEGRPALGEALAKYSKEVPEAYREAYLESAYLKILVAQGRLSVTKADEYLRNLSGVKGFRNTMSKMSGKPHDLKGMPYTSDPNAVGHGFELEFANSLVKNNYKISEIGAKFNDGIKKGLTDIDVIATKGQKQYAFELKNYGKVLTNENLITFRKDIETLKIFSEKNPGTRGIFLISNRPSNVDQIKILEAYGRMNNVSIMYGNAETAAKYLEAIK